MDDRQRLGGALGSRLSRRALLGPEVHRPPQRCVPRCVRVGRIDSCPDLCATVIDSSTGKPGGNPGGKPVAIREHCGRANCQHGGDAGADDCPRTTAASRCS